MAAHLGNITWYDTTDHLARAKMEMNIIMLEVTSTRGSWLSKYTPTQESLSKINVSCCDDMIVHVRSVLQRSVL